MTWFKTYIFDLDGTLVDSLPGVLNAVNVALSEIGMEEIEYEALRQTIGYGLDYMVDCILGEMKEHYGKLFIEKYLQAYKLDPGHNSCLYPGVVNTLTSLREGGAVIGICSNKPIELARKVLIEFNIMGFFSAVTGGDSYPYKKPDPRHISATLSMMDCDAAGAIFIGDSASDIQSAEKANIPSIWAAYGYHDINRDYIQPTFTVYKISEILLCTDMKCRIN